VGQPVPIFYLSEGRAEEVFPGGKEEIRCGKKMSQEGKLGSQGFPRNFPLVEKH
jgi:hypothetical protein